MASEFYKLIFFSLGMAVLGSLFAQKATDICGYYYCEDPFSGEESQNLIYQKDDGSFEGKVVWVKNPKLTQNIGLIFMRNLRYDEETGKWIDGKVRYPGKKSEYSVVVRLESEKILKIRGYVGNPFFGLTSTWKKEDIVRAPIVEK